MEVHRRTAALKSSAASWTKGWNALAKIVAKSLVGTRPEDSDPNHFLPTGPSWVEIVRTLDMAAHKLFPPDHPAIISWEELVGEKQCSTACPERPDPDDCLHIPVSFRSYEYGVWNFLNWLILSSMGQPHVSVQRTMEQQMDNPPIISGCSGTTWRSPLTTKSTTPSVSVRPDGTLVDATGTTTEGKILATFPNVPCLSG